MRCARRREADRRVVLFRGAAWRRTYLGRAAVEKARELGIRPNRSVLNLRPGKADMPKPFVALTMAAVLLACSALPSFADHHGGGGGGHGGGGGWHGAGGGWHGGNGNWNGAGWHGGGGNWHGGGWHHGGHGGGWGVGPAVGLGVGLGLLGGALAAAPYYSGGYDYDYGYPLDAGAPAPAVWYWCDPYQGYYPAVPQCPVPWQQVVQ
jgi:hypothetical protein